VIITALTKQKKFSRSTPGMIVENGVVKASAGSDIASLVASAHIEMLPPPTQSVT
jgi:hypothetical protein